MSTKLMLGDCLKRMKDLSDSSIDAIVTDPPYGLSFMGKKWDYDVPSVEIWQECLRVLKPGGHLLAFAGTRTQHRMAVRIEDAGFEIRDMIAWVYGSGFPKSLDVSKAIDSTVQYGGSSPKQLRKRAMGSNYEPHRLAGTEGFGVSRGGGFGADESRDREQDAAVTTEDAKQWQGWGTALKPALEPITVARKPLCGTVAENVLTHGCGGLNVDGCRVGVADWGSRPVRTPNAILGGGKGASLTTSEAPDGKGRWPANLIHDGSDEVTGLLPYSKDGIAIGSNRKEKHSGNKVYGSRNADTKDVGYSGEGSAARFFYCAKASKKDRGEGNTHPTVKPIALMQYLCRLVTPPSGIVLDPFMGSGSTAIAAIRENLNFVGIEMLREHFETAKRRIVTEKEKPK